MLGRSWKTTALGILGLVVTVATTLQALLSGGHVDITQTLLGVTTGIGLIQAKDHNISGGSLN